MHASPHERNVGPLLLFSLRKGLDQKRQKAIQCPVELDTRAKKSHNDQHMAQKKSNVHCFDEKNVTVTLGKAFIAQPFPSFTTNEDRDTAAWRA
jgi:hypothetical protein